MLHSRPYLVSVALLDGDVSPTQFTPSRLAGPDVRALMARTSVVEDSAITAAYVATVSTRVEITTSDGRTHAATCEQPLGHALNPLPDADLDAKLRRYGDDLLTSGQQASFLSQTWGLDGIGDVGGLLRALRAG
jgi:2-methylcitrate dehydratase